MATFVPRGLVAKDLLAGAGAADYTEVVQSGTRATGYGDYTPGHRFHRATIVKSVVVEVKAADASGTTTVALKKGTGAATGSALVGGTSTVTFDSTVALGTGTITGAWAFAAGEYLQIHTTAVGTTPAAGLRVHVKADHDDTA